MVMGFLVCSLACKYKSTEMYISCHCSSDVWIISIVSPDRSTKYAKLYRSRWICFLISKLTIVRYLAQRPCMSGTASVEPWSSFRIRTNGWAWVDWLSFSLFTKDFALCATRSIIQTSCLWWRMGGLIILPLYIWLWLYVPFPFKRLSFFHFLFVDSQPLWRESHCHSEHHFKALQIPESQLYQSIARSHVCWLYVITSDDEDGGSDCPYFRHWKYILSIVPREVYWKSMHEIVITGFHDRCEWWGDWRSIDGNVQRYHQRWFQWLQWQRKEGGVWRTCEREEASFR